MILYLQKFIYQKLNSYPEIIKQVNAIHYQVPANGNFPYIYIGDFNSKNISTKIIEMAEINFKIMIYMRDKSLKSMLNLSHEIRKILNLDNENRIILMRCLEEKINQQNDGITQQIVMNFRTKIVAENDI